MDETAGLRERKKHETRLAISAAALELALSRGPSHVTVEDIAEAAEVSPRTVFNYFPTKEAAMLGTDPDRRARLVEHLRARPADEDALQALQATFRSNFTVEQVGRWRTRARLARDHPQLHRAYLESWVELEVALAGALAERTGLDPRLDPYPRLVVAVTVTALRVAVDHAIGTGQGDRLSDAVEATFATVAAGLPTPAIATRRPR